MNLNPLTGVQHAYHAVFTYGTYLVIAAVVVRLVYPYFVKGVQK